MNNNKIKKIVIVTMLFMYFSYFICFITTNILRNKYGFIQIGNKMLYAVKEDLGNKLYKKGDLLIISNTSLDDIRKNNMIIISKKDEVTNKFSLTIGKVSKISKEKNNKYVSIEYDYTKWSEDSIAGKINKKHTKIGYLLLFISSGTVFFLLFLIPVLLFCIIEIINWFKDDNNIPKEPEEKKFVIEQANNEQENPKTEEVKEKITQDEKTGAYQIKNNEQPYFIVPNIMETEENIKNEEDEIGTIRVKTVVKRSPEKEIKNQEENRILSNGQELNDDIIITGNDNKPIEIGKGINNFVLKILELKKYEIYTILEIIYKIKNIEVPTTVLKKIISSYTMDKYIQPIDYTEEDLANKDNILKQKIEDYTSKRKNLDAKQKEDVIKSLIFYSTLKEDYSNVEKQIGKYYEFDSENDKNIIVNFIKEKGTGYAKLRKMFSSKVSSTKMFKLITSETPIPNVLNTQIQSNIKFSKIFSEYVIDKSYKESVVMENMEEVLLKLIGTTLVSQVFDEEYTTRYMISFSNTLYSKQRKMKNFTDNFSDPFSQKKIIILINADTLNKHKRAITTLKNSGFNFAIQMKTNELLDSKFDPNTLNVGEYLFIVGKLSQSEKDMFIPNSMLKRLYILKEEINSEVIVV